jgi:glutamate--cysteine ligase catalytic subunit
MGFLDSGDTLEWSEVVFVIDYIKRHGVKQLLHTWEANRSRSFDRLKWGDEVEYVVLSFDDAGKRVRLSLRGADILHVLQQEENAALAEGGAAMERLKSMWRPEYGSFMIEGTPGVPYGHTVEALLDVEPNMRGRRREVQAMLRPGEAIISLTHFPMLGVGDFTDPPHAPGGPVTESLFVPDAIVNPHPRFATLSKNIRARKGRKVDINIPIFMDALTRCPSGEAERHLPGHVYMDAMAFGMGSSCVQCTFQCCNIDEARLFYDAMVPLAPIMLALSANCPIVRGFLADRDCRWDIIAQSVDSRRDEEQEALKALHTEPDTRLADLVARIPPRRTGEVIGESGGSFHGTQLKSRYGAVSLYIGNSPRFHEKYNDVNVRTNAWVYDELTRSGMDATLSRHFAHLFIQDPLVLYKGKIKLDDATHTDHFENIQSTNWQSVRFKPPPPNSNIGWRVEFRSMELQFHDFENAAFVIFVNLLTRVLMQFPLNFYMPISAVDVNMARAQKRGAVLSEKFYWRKHPLSAAAQDDPDGMVELSVAEIVNGSAQFVGLIPLIRRYLSTKLTAPDVLAQVEAYLSFVADRASGRLLTGAAWQRRFVTSHPAYRRDSVVSPEIAYDLLKAVEAFENGPSESVRAFYQ